MDHNGGEERPERGSVGKPRVAFGEVKKGDGMGVYLTKKLDNNASINGFVFHFSKEG